MKSLGHVGIIGRFKPFHNGGATMLEAVLEQATALTICIGSANRKGLRFPFTADESAAMVRAYLDSSDVAATVPVTIVPLDDYGHDPQYADGSRWVEELRKKFTGVQTVVTANTYVADLLKEHYPIVHPANIIPLERQFILDGTQVRLAMARGEPWARLVPKPIADYLTMHGLVDRFRTEYGLMTIASSAENLDTHSYDAEAAAVRRT